MLTVSPLYDSLSPFNSLSGIIYPNTTIYQYKSIQSHLSNIIINRVIDKSTTEAINTN